MTAFDLSPRSARAALAGVAAVEVEDEPVLDRYARAVWSGVAEPGDGVAGAMVASDGAVGALRRV
ncbi:MAG: DNA-protecting protein DprA, partial [Microbacterium sp.]